MNQELAFEKVLGFYTKRAFRSPYREDSSPGCQLKWRGDYLRYYDGGDPIRNGSNVWDLYCINSRGRKIENHQEFLEITKEIDCGGFSIPPPVFNFILRFKEGDYKPYFQDFGITDYQLLSDGVLGVAWYEYNSQDWEGFKRITPTDPCFVYTYGRRKKIYRPEQTERFLKWKTDCTPDDVHFDSFDEFPLLLHCGSYKDARVVKNCGFNVIAWQSETQIPGQMYRWKQQAKRNVFISDIDPGGLENAAYLEKNGLEVAYMPKRLLSLGVKDISEFRKKYGQRETVCLLKQIVYGSL